MGLFYQFAFCYVVESTEVIVVVYVKADWLLVVVGGFVLDNVMTMVAMGSVDFLADGLDLAKEEA